MATQSDFGWELPDLSDVADGPDAFLQFADDIAATVKDGEWTRYTPSWTCVPGSVYPGNPSNTQPANPATRDGFYRVQNKICDVSIRLTFGSTTYGAYGGLQLGLPFSADSRTVYQFMPVSTATPLTGTTWAGLGYIDNGGNTIRPHFPIAINRVDLLPWSSVGAIYINLPVPRMSNDNTPDGRSCISPGGDIQVHGRYRIA